MLIHLFNFHQRNNNQNQQNIPLFQDHKILKRKRENDHFQENELKELKIKRENQLLRTIHCRVFSLKISKLFIKMLQSRQNNLQQMFISILILVKISQILY